MQKLSISYLFTLAWKRLWIIAIVSVIFASAAFSYFKFVVAPKYQATTSIYVTNGRIIRDDESEDNNNNNSSNGIDSSNINSSLGIAYTVIDVLSNHDVYDELSNQLGGSISSQRLMGMVRISRPEDSRSMLLKINVVSPDGNEAIYIANKFAIVCQDFIPKNVGDGIKVYIPTTANSFYKVYPTTFNNTILAALIGAIATYVICFLFDFFDQSIRGEAEFIEKYDIPLLGTIPDFDGSAEGNGSKGYYGKGNYYGKGYY